MSFHSISGRAQQAIRSLALCAAALLSVAAVLTAPSQAWAAITWGATEYIDAADLFDEDGLSINHDRSSIGVTGAITQGGSYSANWFVIDGNYSLEWDSSKYANDIERYTYGNKGAWCWVDESNGLASYDAVTFRYPFGYFPDFAKADLAGNTYPTRAQISDDNQLLLNNVEFTVTYTNVASYHGRKVAAIMTISNMVAAQFGHGWNNFPIISYLPVCYDGTVWGSAKNAAGQTFASVVGENMKAVGIVITIAPPGEEGAQTWLQGIESAEFDITLVYEDSLSSANPEKLVLTDSLFYTFIGQLDADFLGVEGVKLLADDNGSYLADHNLVSNNELFKIYLRNDNTQYLAQGSCTGTTNAGYQQTTPSRFYWGGNAIGSSTSWRGSYVNKDESPVFFGTAWDTFMAKDSSFVDYLETFNWNLNKPGTTTSYRDLYVDAFNTFGLAKARGDYGTSWSSEYPKAHYAGLTYASGPIANAHFILFDSAGSIGTNLSFATATANVPPDPVKEVRETAYTTAYDPSATAVTTNEVSVGEVVHYSIAQKLNKAGIDCASDYAYTSLGFSDTLPAGMSYVAGSFKVLKMDPQSDGSYSGGIIYDSAHPTSYWAGSGSVAPTFSVTGQKLSFSFATGRLPPPTGAYILFVWDATATAEGSYVNGDAGKTPASVTFNEAHVLYANSATTTVVAAAPTASAKLEMTKSADPADGTSVTVGRVITYTLNVKNAGDAAAENVAVRDCIPKGCSYLAASASAGGSYDDTAAAPFVQWSGLSLAAGASTTLTFSVRVTSSEASVVSNIAQAAIDWKTDSDFDEKSNEVSHPVVQSVPTAAFISGAWWAGLGAAALALALAGGILLRRRTGRHRAARHRTGVRRGRQGRALRRRPACRRHISQ